MTEVPSAGMTTGSLNEPYPTLASSFGQLILDRCAKSASKEAFRAPHAGRRVAFLHLAADPRRGRARPPPVWSRSASTEERVAIASNTRLEWIVADYAIMLAGGATTTVCPSTGDEDVEFILRLELKILIAEDQGQADKAATVSSVGHIVLIDGEGDGDKTISWAQLREKGKAALAETPDLIQQRVDATGPDKLSTLIYTSGTTGKPKGVELTHANWTYEGAALADLNILQETGSSSCGCRWPTRSARSSFRCSSRSDSSLPSTAGSRRSSTTCRWSSRPSWRLCPASSRRFTPA